MEVGIMGRKSRVLGWWRRLQERSVAESNVRDVGPIWQGSRWVGKSLERVENGPFRRFALRRAWLAVRAGLSQAEVGLRYRDLLTHGVHLQRPLRRFRRSEL